MSRCPECRCTICECGLETIRTEDLDAIGALYKAEREAHAATRRELEKERDLLQAYLNQERAENSQLRAKLAEARGELVAIGAAAGTEEWAVREYGLTGLPDTIAQWRGEAAQAEALKAKLARYEAPGPALLVAEHDSDCDHASGARSCIFDLAVKADAYREQHARCVAVVERVEREHLARIWPEANYLRGVRTCLAALKDGAK